MNRRPGDAQPVLQGIASALVGFAGAFAIVLAGLRAVGADTQEAASGLMALSIGMGICGIALSLRTRMPINVAWSTPGAALLVSTGAVEGGYPAAIGAFLLTGVLIVAAGFWRRLARWIAAIPSPLANALLAGVLLPICLTPARSLVELPWLTAPMIVVWLVLTLFARRWAVIGALVATAAAIAIDQPIANPQGGQLVPDPVFTAPVFELGALLGLGIPLFIVTMASQNITGMSVLASFGYRPPLRPILLATGTATAAAAPFGGHAINLAAITAALTAGPDAHPDPGRRWIAAASTGVTYLGLGFCAGAATVLLAASPPLLIEAVAGVAMLGTLGAALAGAMGSEDHREAATITFVASASGIVALGITAPFWGLLAGLAFLGATALRNNR